MDNQEIHQLLVSFGIATKIESWKPFGHSHINDTFLIRIVGNNLPDYILQRKNHMIFKDVPGMLNNILLATEHIRAQLKSAGETEIDRKVMTYLPATDGKYFVQDDHGNYWTLFIFIRDSHGIEEVTRPDRLPERRYLLQNRLS